MCGFAATCGRPIGHRGHHGGWRSGVAGVAANPVPRVQQSTARYLGGDLTPREMSILAEWFVHGHYRPIALCLGISEQTVKNHAANVQVKTGAESMSHAAYVLGWVTFPAGLAHREEAS